METTVMTSTTTVSPSTAPFYGPSKSPTKCPTLSPTPFFVHEIDSITANGKIVYLVDLSFLFVPLPEFSSLQD